MKSLPRKLLCCYFGHLNGEQQGLTLQRKALPKAATNKCAENGELLDQKTELKTKFRSKLQTGMSRDNKDHDVGFTR